MDQDLERFTQAQRDSWAQALHEIEAGAKRTHWMWFIFPQIAGLGQSATARFYAIRDLEEAGAFLAHPVLGPRLVAFARATLAWGGQRSADAIFGQVDAMKLRSSATLFEAAGGDPVFSRLLDRFFDGGRDAATLRLIGR